MHVIHTQTSKRLTNNVGMCKLLIILRLLRGS